MSLIRMERTSGLLTAITEILSLIHIYISPHQLSYVTNSGEGEGLLFYGNVILPFVDRFPKDIEPVSYTHLDVYKRQVCSQGGYFQFCTGGSGVHCRCNS